MAPSQGVHLVLDRSFLTGDSAVMIPAYLGRRVLFAVPWHGRVVLGTTDTEVNEVSLEPRPLDEEIDFLLTHAARYLIRRPTRADVLSAFAGLRPLVRQDDGGDTSSLSREHAILISGSGLVTITGGKWTISRKMGEDTINQAAAVAGLEERPSATTGLRLHGWQSDGKECAPWDVYGADAAMVRKLAAGKSVMGCPATPEPPLSRLRSCLGGSQRMADEPWMMCWHGAPVLFSSIPGRAWRSPRWWPR